MKTLKSIFSYALCLLLLTSSVLNVFGKHGSHELGGRVVLSIGKNDKKIMDGHKKKVIIDNNSLASGGIIRRLCNISVTIVAIIIILVSFSMPYNRRMRKTKKKCRSEKFKEKFNKA